MERAQLKFAKRGLTVLKQDACRLIRNHLAHLQAVRWKEPIFELQRLTDLCKASCLQTHFLNHPAQ